MEAIASRVSVLLVSLLWSAVLSAAPRLSGNRAVPARQGGGCCLLSHRSDLRTNNPAPRNPHAGSIIPSSRLPTAPHYPDCWEVAADSLRSPTGPSSPTGRRPRQRRCRESRSVVGSPMIRLRKRDSCFAFPTTGTASSSWLAPPARAASTTATGRGAITFCPGDMRTPRRTRACSTCTFVSFTSATQPASDPLSCRLNPSVANLGSLLRQRSGKALYAVDAIHVENRRPRAQGGEGELQPIPAAYLCRGHVQRWVSGAAGHGRGTQSIRRGRGLGRHLHQSVWAESSDRLAAGDTEFPRLRCVELRPHQPGGAEHTWRPATRQTS